MENIIRIESLNDYINQVSNFVLPRERLVSKSIKLFRGLSDFEYDNTPSIGRCINTNIHNPPVIFEEKISRVYKIDVFGIFRGCVN